MDGQSTQLNDRDFELLSQWLDGELDVARKQALDKRMAEDAGLRDTAQALRRLNQDLREALYHRSPVPPEVEDLLRSAATETPAPQRGSNVLPFPGTASSAPAAKWRSRWPVAVAASVLLAATGLTLQLSRDPVPDGLLPGNDALVGKALDTQLSGSGWAELGDGRALQPVLSFEHQNGNWCREFLLRGRENNWRAVACRSPEGWSTQAAGLESYLDGGQAYRPAGASDSAPVAVFISQNAADIALNREQELELIGAGWL